MSSEVVGRFQGTPSLSNLAVGEVIGIVVKAAFTGFAASEVGSAPLTNRADTAPRLEWWLERLVVERWEGGDYANAQAPPLATHTHIMKSGEDV